MSRISTVATLGAAQTLAWASSFYLPAILAAAMAREMGVPTASVFAVFSLALLVSALIGPYAGRAIDRWGGRPVLMSTSLIFATGLCMLGLANGMTGLVAAWLVLGVGMGAGLYDGAFAALVRLYGRDARNAITGITLIAGFASTVGWPLSSLLDAQFGRRGACFAWAALHVLLGLPLNAWLPRTVLAPAPQASSQASVVAPGIDSSPVAGARSTTVKLAFVFATAGFVSTAMASHFPALLQACGSTLALAVAAGALIGPAQVAARLLEFGFLRRAHPLISARLATLMHPLGAGVLALVGAPAAAAFALLHGGGNGVITIAKGTLPLAFFGPQSYGARQGLIMLPARMAQALAPWLFGLCLDRWGAQVLWLSAGLGLAAFGVLMWLPRNLAGAQGGEGPRLWPGRAPSK